MPSLEWNRFFGRDATRFSEKNPHEFYGERWGPIGSRPELKDVLKKYVEPFTSENKICLEVGSGGGRWTEHLLECQQVICVELNPEMFICLRKRFGDKSKLVYVLTNGADLPLVPRDYVDFVFSYGTFVYLEMDIISKYIESIASVMKQEADIVIQTSNNRKKRKRFFSDTTNEFILQNFNQNQIETIKIDDDILAQSTIFHGRKI